MSVDKNILGLVNLGREKGGSAIVRVDSLHKPPVSLADLIRPRSRGKTKNLIGLLLGHGARARRAAMPRARVRLSVFAPTGYPAVKIGFQ